MAQRNSRYKDPEEGMYLAQTGDSSEARDRAVGQMRGTGGVELTVQLLGRHGDLGIFSA